MSPFEIKTNKPGIAPVNPHFYVLCKGLNSGKPLKSPCPNCFIVKAESEKVLTTLYWITYSLWKGNKLYPFHRGSVIPFITLRDYSKILAESFRKAEPEGKDFENLLMVLNLLEEKEQQAHEQIAQIRKVQALVFHRLSKM